VVPSHSIRHDGHAATLKSDVRGGEKMARIARIVAAAPAEPRYETLRDLALEVVPRHAAIRG
jgi:hypothetical protein